MLTKSRAVLLVTLLSLLLSALEIAGQTALPPCGQREFIVLAPRANSRVLCLERPLHRVEGGELAFTALAYHTNGDLYALRPLTGQLLHLRDSDGDLLPDQVDVVADGMRLPAGLAAHENALYILGDGIIYQYADGTLTTLVDDLPGRRGFAASGIAVNDSGIYAGIPFPCDVCEADDERHGTVMRFNLDGTDGAIIGRGLRYPAGLALHDGTLWVTDSARDGLLLDAPYLDELNRIDLDETAVPHFGFPYCVGNNQPDSAGDFDCGAATAPVIRLETGSTPMSVTPYEADAFRWLNGTLLLGLRGSPDNARVRGYAVYSVQPESSPLHYEALFPADEAIAGDARLTNDTNILDMWHTALVNRRGGGMWPHPVLDVVVSPQGWITVSVGGGSLYIMRPLVERNPCDGLRECE